MALNLGAVICLLLNFNLVACILSFLAYFASIKEVSKYTSWYQFANTFGAALILGFSIDQSNNCFPFFTIIMFAAALGSILRIVMFSVFSYTGHTWYEPTMFVISIGAYFYVNFTNTVDWKAWTFPAPIILFAGILGWGILKDKKQLLAHTKGGYRVQIGEPADQFQLPDQDGNVVKLSDFKNDRHLLLIFVRGDWCPGCHMMLRTYEKNNLKFKEKNILVMAIGPDPVGVNRGMVEKLGLDFKVLSDEGQKTAMIYGVQLKEYDNDFAEKYD
jgi:peroxiredoxin